MRALPKEAMIVSSTGKISRELFEVRERLGQDHSRDFLTVGSMGHGSSIAMRIAERRPERPILCLDGDGAALMHLGAMALIPASGAPLIHVVLDNGAHETVGGMPTVAGRLDLAGAALALGYASAADVSSVAELKPWPPRWPAQGPPSSGCGWRWGRGRTSDGPPARPFKTGTTL